MPILSGGGGGGLPTGWTQSGNPAVVDAQAGMLVGLTTLGFLAGAQAKVDNITPLTPLGLGSTFQLSATGSDTLELYSVDNTAGTASLRCGNAAFMDLFVVQGDSKIGLYGATPVVQPGAITAPSGGAIQDAESRTAIAAILAVLGAAAGGIGITA